MVIEQHWMATFADSEGFESNIVRFTAVSDTDAWETATSLCALASCESVTLLARDFSPPTKE